MELQETRVDKLFSVEKDKMVAIISLKYAIDRLYDMLDKLKDYYRIPENKINKWRPLVTYYDMKYSEGNFEKGLKMFLFNFKNIYPRKFTIIPSFVFNFVKTEEHNRRIKRPVIGDCFEAFVT